MCFILETDYNNELYSVALHHSHSSVDLKDTSWQAKLVLGLGLESCGLSICSSLICGDKLGSAFIYITYCMSEFSVHISTTNFML